MKPTRQLTGKRCEAGQKARPSHYHLILLGDPLPNTKPATDGEERVGDPVPGTHHAEGGGAANPAQGQGSGRAQAEGSCRVNGDYFITTFPRNDRRVPSQEDDTILHQNIKSE